jgi:hypothetical protein
VASASFFRAKAYAVGIGGACAVNVLSRMNSD